MLNSTTLKRHAALVDRMADTLGLDLEEAVLSGQMRFDSLSDAVLACTACSNPEGCERWLEMQTGRAPEAPGICRNTRMFEDLKAGRQV